MRHVLILSLLLAAAPAAAEESEESERLPPVANALVKKECGACHMTYQPQLLPGASWEAIFADLGRHFGEDATLDDKPRAEILAYYLANAGKGKAGRASPNRITETPWWIGDHRGIGEARWNKAKFKGNCVACHEGAERGYYEDD